MKKWVALGFFLLFTFQVGIKSLVTLYFQICGKQEKEKHCIYKSITTCKGNCYVIQKIKIITSTPDTGTKNAPDLDINTFKDAVCTVTEMSQLITGGNDNSLFILEVSENNYSYLYSQRLIKPPIA